MGYLRPQNGYLRPQLGNVIPQWVWVYAWVDKFVLCCKLFKVYIIEMTMKCERCNMEFKCESMLKRHQARKKPCERGKKYELCKFCKKTCDTIKAQHRHEKQCKFKDDFVRNLELELDIDVIYDYSNNTCRFCGKKMRVDNLCRHESICIEKEVYKFKLQNMLRAHHSKKSGNTTIHNTQNITQNNNFIVLNPFGKENLSYITPSYILKLMEKAKCNFAGDEEKLRFATLMYKAIHGNPEHPENHNMLIPSLKGSTALIYTDDGFEHIHRRIAEDKVLDTIAEVTYENVSLPHDDELEEEERKRCKMQYVKFVNKYIEGIDTYDNDNAQNRQIISQASYNCKDLIRNTHKLSQVSLES